MSKLLRNLILLSFIASEFFCAEGIDDKLQKSLKASDFKRKLGESESHLPVTTVQPVTTVEGFYNEPISVLGITVPPEFENSTVTEDSHTYFNSTFYTDPEVAKRFWLNMDASTSQIHQMLSDSHRQATTVELSFEFPFYGHLLKNITIATGGFLYMGDYLHNWIAATQYVAPLMANFDTSQSVHSVIKYVDNGTAFTAQWENVFIQDGMNDGSFTFQVTLMKNGDIVFAYKDIPYPVANISDARHPVKIGISDAYILERSLFFVRRKTIYEYHRIDMLKRNISNNTALYFVALPTCPGYKNCSSCLAADPKMECSWCSAIQRCSDGIDRARQNWLTKGCAINKETTCSAQPPPISTDKSMTADTRPDTSHVESSTRYDGKTSSSKYEPSTMYNVNFTSSATDPSVNEVHGPAPYMQEKVSIGGGISAGAVITIVVFIAVLLGAGMWIGYAYKFPQTTSGQFLIKYRPSQWTLKGKDDNSVSASSRHI